MCSCRSSHEWAYDDPRLAQCLTHRTRSVNSVCEEITTSLVLSQTGGATQASVEAFGSLLEYGEGKSRSFCVVLPLCRVGGIPLPHPPNLFWMLRLVTPHVHQEDMKGLVIHRMRLSGESRVAPKQMQERRLGEAFLSACPDEGQEEWPGLKAVGQESNIKTTSDSPVHAASCFVLCGMGLGGHLPWAPCRWTGTSCDPPFHGEQTSPRFEPDG